MQEFGNWRFDVSGMTPAQLAIIISALNERIVSLHHAAMNYGVPRNNITETQFLTAVVARLERGLPDNQPFPAGKTL